MFLAGDLDEAAQIESALREPLMIDPNSVPYRAVVSVLDLVPRDQTGRLAVIARIRQRVATMHPFARGDDAARVDRLEHLLVDKPVTIEDLPANLRWRFFGEPGTAGNFVFVLHDVPLNDTRQAAVLVDAVRTVQGPGGEWHAASDAIVVADLLRIMKADSVRAITLAALAVFLVLAVNFRSIRRAAIASVPLALGLLWMIALMWSLGIRLNFYNMVVFPSLLGMGVDAGIHVYHRYLEAPAEPLSSLGPTGSAVAVSSLTTMIAFGSMMASMHQGLASLGRLAVVGLACILVAATVVFPALLPAAPDERGRSRLSRD